MKNKELLLEAINNTIVELEKAYTQEELSKGILHLVYKYYKRDREILESGHEPWDSDGWVLAGGCYAYADQAGYQYKHSEAVGNCMHQAEKLMKEEMDLTIKEGKFKIKDA